MKHLYIPVSQFTFLEMVTNTVLRDTDSSIRYARFRHTVEVWYPSELELRADE